MTVQFWIMSIVKGSGAVRRRYQTLHLTVNCCFMTKEIFFLYAFSSDLAQSSSLSLCNKALPFKFYSGWLRLSSVLAATVPPSLQAVRIFQFCKYIKGVYIITDGPFLWPIGLILESENRTLRLVVHPRSMHDFKIKFEKS